MFEPNKFQTHIKMLNNPDNRTKIVGLQEIFFGLEAGILPAYSQRKVLESAIIRIISRNKDSRVRRWAYMIGAFCHNEKLVRISKKNLPKESDFENRTWIMAILATNLDAREFDFAVRHLDHGLTLEEIKIATYLFQKSDKYQLRKSDVDTIISRNDKVGIFWIGSNAGYANLAVRRHKEIIITNETVSELTRHDDDEVLKHLMYAYSCQGNGSLSVRKDIKFDISDFVTMSPHHKKWFLTAIWKDSRFIEENQDYVCQVLDTRHLKSCDKRIREGIARGISEYRFSSFLVRPIEEWLSYEGEISVRYFLIRYITRWADMCAKYQELVWNEIGFESKKGSELTKTFMLSDQYEKYLREKEKSLMPKKPSKIFISHSSKDIKYVDAIVRLLQDIGLRSSNDIFCSSAPGYDVPVGYDIYDYLLQQFRQYDLHVFYVLSDNYYKSIASLNEMGAAWALQSEYTSILLPGFDFVNIKGAINPNKSSIKLDHDPYEVKDKLGQIKTLLINEFGLQDYSGTIWEMRRDRFIDEINNIANIP